MLTQTAWMQSHVNPQEFFKSIVQKHLPYSDVSVLAIGSIGKSKFYAAVEGNGLVHLKRITVVYNKDKRHPLNSEAFEVVYAIESENELGLDDFGCPTYILSLLSPFSELEKAYGIGWQGKGIWRETAMKVAIERGKPENNPRLFVGDIVEFDEPLCGNKRFVITAPRPMTQSLGIVSVMGISPMQVFGDYIDNWRNKRFRIITVNRTHALNSATVVG